MHLYSKKLTFVYESNNVLNNTLRYKFDVNRAHIS